MDRECAFCGRDNAAARRVFCTDCNSQHKVCIPCADEAATESDLYRLVA